MSFSTAFQALTSRNFRYYFIGQLISVNGQWIKRVAISWIVYKLTASGFLIGLNEMLSLAPVILIAPLAGAWLEGADLRRALIGTQTLCMLQSLFLAMLWGSGHAQYWHMAFLSLYLGLVNSVDSTCRQTSVSYMVDDPLQLKSAIALNSIAFNSSRFIGPAIGGALIYWVGETVCFLIAALCQLPMIMMLLFRIRLRDRGAATRGRHSLIASVGEGVRYIRSDFLLRTALRNIFLYSLFGCGVMVMFPLVSTQQLGGGVRLLGLLIAAQGVGALCAVFSMAAFVPLGSMARWLAFTMASASLGYGFISQCSSIPPAMILAGFIGIGQTGAMVATNVLVQSVAAEGMRGRAVSLYMMIAHGVGPIASMGIGWALDMFGIRATSIFLGLALAVVLLLWLWFLPRMTAELRQVRVR